MMKREKGDLHGSIQEYFFNTGDPGTLVAELIEHIPRAMKEVLLNHGKAPKQERG
jgi:hypothetical protein